MFNYSEIKSVRLDNQFVMEVQTFSGDKFTIIDNHIVKKNGEAVRPVECDERLATSADEKAALEQSMDFIHLLRLNDDEEGNVVLTVADVNGNRITTTTFGGSAWSDETKKEFFVDARDAMLNGMDKVDIDKDDYSIRTINKTEGGASELCGKLLGFIGAL